MLPCLIHLLLCTLITNDSLVMVCLPEMRYITSPVSRTCSIALHLGGLFKEKFVAKWKHLQPWNCNAVMSALVGCAQTCCFKAFRYQGQVFTDALHVFYLLIPVSLCWDIAWSLWGTGSWFLKFFVSGTWFCQEMRYSEGRVYGLLSSAKVAKAWRTQPLKNHRNAIYLAKFMR